MNNGNKNAVLYILVYRTCHWIYLNPEANVEIQRQLGMLNILVFVPQMPLENMP